MRAGLLVALATACGTNAPEVETDPSREAELEPVERYAYTVRVDEDLQELEVTVCFDGPHGASLHCPQATATIALRGAEVRVPGEAPRPIARRDRELPIPGDLADDACVTYRVDIDDAMGASWSNGTRVEGAVLVNVSGWLWSPRPLARGATGTLTLDLPAGVEAALSFPREDDGSLRLDPSAFHYLSHTIFGRFDRFEVDVPGGRLDVARLPGELEVSDDEVARWLGAAATTAAQLHGRFPVPEALVAVVPVAGGDDVAFGNVGRGGGSSVMLLTSRRATYDGLVEDWVPPHEFTHLSMPYVSRGDAWMSEGVATYYQEVLRARAGIQTPLEAWRAIDHGFASGREDGTGRSLEIESAQMYQTAAFRRVYWAGTAIALLADVALRREGHSLDEAIAGLPECCMVPKRTWSGREMADAFDRITGTEVYRHVADRWLTSHDFPEVAETFAFLGLARNDDGLLELDEGAPGAAIARAIMTPRDDIAD